MSIVIKAPSGGGSISLDTQQSVTGDHTLQLPTGVGTAGQVLQNSSTAGTLEFAQGGKILQVVQTIKTDNFETTDTSFVDVTSLSASITPSSSSSKVLVRAVVCAGTGAANADNKIRLLRGSTAITTNDVFVRNDSISESESFVIEILDSPSTTSSTTYKIQAKAESNEVFVNRRNNDDTMGQSSITLMEVAS